MSKPDTRDFEERYKACFTDFVLKTGAGLLIGGMIGSFFMRSARRWPLFIGGGLGFGMAYTNCENSLNEFLLSLDPKACKIKLTVNPWSVDSANPREPLLSDVLECVHDFPP